MLALHRHTRLGFGHPKSERESAVGGGGEDGSRSVRNYRVNIVVSRGGREGKGKGKGKEKETRSAR